MRQAQARRMTAVCQIVRNPSVTGTGITTVASELACTPPLPPGGMSKWGQFAEMATDYELFEMTTAHNPDVQRFDVVLIDGQALTISKMLRYPARGFAAGYLYLLVEDRM